MAFPRLLQGFLVLCAVSSAHAQDACPADAAAGTICLASVTVTRATGCTLNIAEDLTIAGGGGLSRDIVYVPRVQSVRIINVTLNDKSLDGPPRRYSLERTGASTEQLRVPASARNGSKGAANLSLNYMIEDGVLRLRGKSCNETVWPKDADYLSWETGRHGSIKQLDITFRTLKTADALAPVKGFGNFTETQVAGNAVNLKIVDPELPLSAYVRMKARDECPKRIDQCQVGSKRPIAWVALPVIAFAACICALCVTSNGGGKR